MKRLLEQAQGLVGANAKLPLAKKMKMKQLAPMQKQPLMQPKRKAMTKVNPNKNY